MTALVNIRCRPLSLSISREACGAQVTRPHAPAVCRDCEVGMAHARGEAATCWPDGSAVQERTIEIDAPLSTRAVAPRPAMAFSSPHRHAHKGRGERDEPAVRGALRRMPGVGGVGEATWLHMDREMTARELAALPGVTLPAGTIGRRLKSGQWSVERAIRQRVDLTKRSAR